MRKVVAAETALGGIVVGALRRHAGWRSTVLPYVGHGTRTRAHLRARVLLWHRDDGLRRPATGPLTAALPFLSVEVTGETVHVEVAGQHSQDVSGREGYVTVDLVLPGLEPGWHPVAYRLAGDGAPDVDGRLLVVDPAATLGVVSDIDDTVIHTGLTRLVETVRTTFLHREEERVPIEGAAEFYRALVAGDEGRAPVFYVSTGAWNLHHPMQRFLERHAFPAGPLLMTDWGPGTGRLFREDGVAFKSRTILALMAEHPHLRWVLVGDSGQHDPEAYAVVARARPDRVRAIYIRQVQPAATARVDQVRRIAAELGRIGIPMLLLTDGRAAVEHATGLGLLDPGHQGAGSHHDGR